MVFIYLHGCKSNTSMADVQVKNLIIRNILSGGL